MNTGNYYLINLPNFGDERGQMCVAECDREIPFTIQRVFYDYNNVASCEARGNHANRNSSFVFICVHGSCTIRVNDGYNENVFVMDNPQKALFVNKMVWKEMFDYSIDSVLLILSNEKYNSNEYIRDFKEFKNVVNNSNKIYCPSSKK